MTAGWKDRILPVAKLLVKFLIAGILIAWMVGDHGRAMLRTIAETNPLWIFGCGILIAGQIFLTSLRWRCLIPPDLRPSVSETLQLTLKGIFANLFLPAGAVGGDVVKIGLFAVRLPKERRVEAAITVVVDRIVGMVGLFSLTILVFLICFSSIRTLEPGFRWTVYLLVAICFCGLAAAGALFLHDFIFRFSPAKKLLDLSDRLLKGIPSETVHAIAAYRNRWPTILRMIILSALIIHPLLICAVFVPLYGTMDRLPPFRAVLTAGAFGGSAAVVPLTPGGLGTRDLVARNFMTSYGVPENDAIAATVIYTAMLCCIMAAGGLLFFLPEKSKKKEKAS